MVWIYTSGTGTIAVPAPSACANRMYAILNYSGGARTITSFQNLSNTATTSIANNTSIWIVSDGTSWYQIK
jgi:hypothetical protein